MDRRTFLKTIGISGAVGLARPDHLLAGRAFSSPEYFDLHPFIKEHPEAVFIRRTNVADKTDSEAKRQEGIALARDIFVLAETPGVPLSHRVAIKANTTCGGSPQASQMGILTDVHFVEGVIEGMKTQLGLPGSKFYVREGNWLGDSYCPEAYWESGYGAMCERTGANGGRFDSGRLLSEAALRNLEEGSEVTWVDYPQGVVFRRIGYVAPYNQPDTWLLNIAKLKAHGMGMTLCCKNHQGTCVHPYIHFCAGVQGTISSEPRMAGDFQPDVMEHVAELHAQHLEAGVPRWDKPGSNWNSGYGMEMWGQRTCDNLDASDTRFCIIEGIYGRNGNGFDLGPGPGRTAQDFMTNVLIFGKDPFRADIIGNWLAGHEPGSFGLFHIAWDRGLSTVLNPMDIPVYLWEDPVPRRISLTELERTPLVTHYMRRNYAGQSEPEWHLVDEEFDYGPYTSVEHTDVLEPTVFVLAQNYPNPFDPSTLIEYRLPRGQHARIEVYNAAGQQVDVLVDAWRCAGAHLVQWNGRGRGSGTYFLRLRAADGFQITRKMVLIR